MKSLQTLLKKINDTANVCNFSMNINAGKIKAMVVAKDTINANINVERKSIEQVQKLSCQGQIIKEDVH